MMRLTCRDLAAFLDAYIAGRLPLETAAAFRWHLSRCPACVSYVESYQNTLLAETATGQAESSQLPEELVEAILSARDAIFGAGSRP